MKFRNVLLAPIVALQLMFAAALSTAPVSVPVVAAVVAGTSLIAPKAEAAAMSNYLENALVDAFLRGQAFTMPATVYIALETAAGSDTGCGTEVSGGAYARATVTSSLANWAGTQSAGSTVASSGTGGTTSNNSPITFPAPSGANWGTVVGFCAMSASTAGNTYFRANLTTSKTVNNGDAAPSFAAGALTFQLDN